MNLAKLARAEAIALAACAGRPPAHDGSHVLRVARLADEIARGEAIDPFACRLAALLHELVNLPKDHPESAKSGELCAVEAARVMDALEIDATTASLVREAIAVHGFSKGAAPGSAVAAVLQDADRLDAIGAVGIARCFATGGELGRPLFAIDDPLCRAREPDDRSNSLDHFFKKLLRIEAGLHTATARRLAGPRIAAMRAFLDALDAELVASSIS